ncbi:MAG: extracellular solute-binding protein [Ruminococcaceae bacterium]|nr:extracellular solute-binding protein [Oscillospiraceae bacterium]
MKIKKVLSIFLAGCMLAAALTGCGKNETLSESVLVDGNTMISKEPIELSAFMDSSKEGDGQWQLLKEAYKMTNVNVVPTLSKSNTEFNQTFSLMIASGNIPDIVQTYKPSQFCELAMEGAFVALNDYFDTHLVHFKQFLSENPDVKKEITASDGNIYYIPFIPGGDLSQGWFVRQDWLDKLGLKAPTNAEEMYTVLKAMKTQDPNGNGLADEVPYFETEKGANLFPLWGARQSFYVENGEVKYGKLEDEFVPAIKNIIKWYEEGLLDPEIVTRSTNGRDTLLGNNIGGMTNDWFGSTARYNEKLAEAIPGFNFCAFAPPCGIQLSKRPPASGYGWGVSASSEYLNEALLFLDFFFTEEGNRLINYGVEGLHYDMVDGKPTFKAELVAQPNFQKQLTDFGVQVGVGYKQDYEYEKQWLNDIALEGLAMYEEGDWVVEQMSPNLSLKLNSVELEEYNSLYTQVTTYDTEMYQKWILGAEDFDQTYPKFKKEVKKLGYDRLMELMQLAYDRYNGKK